MMAWAAETAAETAAHAPEPFYATAEFWVLVAFLIFVGAVARTAYRVVVVALDDRAEKIKDQIDEAMRLSEEAQELLATYERKQRDAEVEAETIIEHARQEADRLADNAQDDLAKALKRREQLAMERIAQAEATAVAEVRGQAVEIAMEATRRILAQKLSAKSANALVDQAIAELPKKLH